MQSPEKKVWSASHPTLPPIIMEVTKMGVSSIGSLPFKYSLPYYLGERVRNLCLPHQKNGGRLFTAWGRGNLSLSLLGIRSRCCAILVDSTLEVEFVLSGSFIWRHTHIHTYIHILYIDVCRYIYIYFIFIYICIFIYIYTPFKSKDYFLNVLSSKGL